MAMAGCPAGTPTASSHGCFTFWTAPFALVLLKTGQNVLKHLSVLKTPPPPPVTSPVLALDKAWFGPVLALDKTWFGPDNMRFEGL